MHRPFRAAAPLALVLAACGGLIEKTGGTAEGPSDSGAPVADAAPDSGPPDGGTDSAPVPPAPTCTDGSKNGTEADVDCGGATCAACATDRTCRVDADCAAGAQCRSGVCVAIPRVTAVAAGSGHTCARFDNGVVVCWGENTSGQLGLGDRNDRGDGPGEMGAALPAVDLGAGRKALSVTASYAHSCALLDDGAVKCWGKNGSGQLGLGDENDRGDNPGEMGDALPAVDLGTGRTARAVAAAYYHTCALLDDGAVKCWGANPNGELGLGDRKDRGDAPGEMGDALPPVDFGAGRKAVAIAAGNFNVCAILDDGAVKCWGDNTNGPLGLGDTRSRGDAKSDLGDALPAVDLGTGRTARAVTSAGSHTCALLDTNAVKCWGMNYHGALGLGDTSDRGDGPGEMGDNLPAVPLGTGRTPLALASGFYRSCALLDDGAVKCWGSNTNGLLGLGDTNHRGDTPGELGDALPAVDLGAARTVQALTAGGFHACALLDNSAVKCWGANFHGALGLGDTNNRGRTPREMGDNLRAVDLGARVR